MKIGGEFCREDVGSYLSEHGHSGLTNGGKYHMVFRAHDLDFPMQTTPFPFFFLSFFAFLSFDVALRAPRVPTVPHSRMRCDLLVAPP